MSAVFGVADAEIARRPVQWVTGRIWKGSAFGGARGRTDVPNIVDQYMEHRIEIDPLIAHKLAQERISKAFDLMRSGESIRTVAGF